ncbi:MAG: hypothetical protein H6835_16750 [Planctomycetes bacterium]|nr:hypothetical protein [Planctomycetota bacterium]
MSIRTLALLPLLSSTLSLLAPLAAQTVVFQSDFDGALPSAVAPGAATLEGVQGYAGLGPAGDQFGGTFLRSPTGNPVTIQLNGLPPHNAIRLDFLFAAIDSLDGTGSYPSGDFFAIRIDGNVFFRESFANATSAQVQSYVSPPGVELARRVDLGFSGPGGFYTDSAYWLGGDPRFFAIGHSASSLTIEMRIEGPGIQSLSDESWALDNLTISTLTGVAQGSVTVYGASCGPLLSAIGAPSIGQGLTVYLDALPAGTLVPGLAIGLSDTTFGGLPLPLSLASLGAPGCWLHNDTAVQVAAAMQSFGTTAQTFIPLPSDPQVIGFVFFLQGWGFAPGFNAFGIATSNGLRVQVGQ